MRSLLCLLLLSHTVQPLMAQAARAGSPWTIHLALARDAFTGASSDTTTLPGTRVEVVPTPRLAFEVGLTRRVGQWQFGLSGGYASGGLRASTDDLFVDERSGGVDRYRASLMLRREVAHFESAVLSAAAGALIDHWRVSTLGDRTSSGVRAGVVLGIPLTRRLVLENIALLSVGGGPFERSALPPEAEVSSMWSWSFGLGLAIRP